MVLSGERPVPAGPQQPARDGRSTLAAPASAAAAHVEGKLAVATWERQADRGETHEACAAHEARARPAMPTNAARRAKQAQFTSGTPSLLALYWPCPPLVPSSPPPASSQTQPGAPQSAMFVACVSASGPQLTRKRLQRAPTDYCRSASSPGTLLATIDTTDTTDNDQRPQRATKPRLPAATATAATTALPLLLLLLCLSPPPSGLTSALYVIASSDNPPLRGPHLERRKLR
ncbi:hypothetical protein AOQ84DRAFT_226816 [Glonium stellatum]|uniref:Uncharacterized protein n=1 Tax=Glonium stellatum TaxID=574774 RepID=A0A8E2ESM6_9PEZI|nr:hypothetical protein AOQ84DRAFT_226816 [Glonium stellatum]